MYYAQLNENKICVGTSSLSGKIDVPHMIEITEQQYANGDLLGRKYLSKGKWCSKPKPESPPEPEPQLSDTE